MYSTAIYRRFDITLDKVIVIESIVYRPMAFRNINRIYLPLNKIMESITIESIMRYLRNQILGC